METNDPFRFLSEGMALIKHGIEEMSASGAENYFSSP
jgi:hypothetical protein